MADFIDREALMKFPIRRDHCDKEHANEHFINGIETVMEYAENLPTADVEPVRHGRWVESPCLYYGAKQYVCSICYSDTFWNKYSITVKYPHCPNCGADMRGINDE